MYNKDFYNKGIEEANGILTFLNIDFGTVRVIINDDIPWFVGKDIANILGYKDTDQALRKHVYDEDKLTRRFDGSGQIREMVLINETGLYSLVFRSKLKSAKKFTKWVVNEVLPSIRKHGIYIDPNHPNIRMLSKIIRNDCETAMNALLAYGRLFNPFLSNDFVFGTLSKIANELAGIEDGKRDNANSEQLLKLMCIESTFTRTIYVGIGKRKHTSRIINHCRINSEEKLRNFNFEIGGRSDVSG